MNGDGELSANLCSARGRMTRDDGGSGEGIDGSRFIRSPRAKVGELVRDAHATFVSFCKIGPAILSNVMNKNPNQTGSEEIKGSYLAYP